MITLDAGPAAAVVAPDAGGRIASLSVFGSELLVTEQRAVQALGEPPGPFGWGIFPMAPWAGRIRHGRFEFEGCRYQLPINFPPHAIHGTLAERQPDRAEVIGSSQAVLSWGLGPPWPFAGRVTQRVALAPDGLALALEIRAGDAMPVTCGWHPWWARDIGADEPAQLVFEPEAMYALDEESIPTGELVPPPAGPWDNCFPLPPSPIRVRWPGALEVVMATDCAEVVVFTQRPYGLCAEPQTGPPDAVNLGIHCAVLAPGEVLRAQASWRWTRLA